MGVNNAERRSSINKQTSKDQNFGRSNSSDFDKNLFEEGFFYKKEMMKKLHDKILALNEEIPTVVQIGILKI